MEQPNIQDTFIALEEVLETKCNEFILQSEILDDDTFEEVLISINTLIDLLVQTINVINQKHGSEQTNS